MTSVSCGGCGISDNPVGARFCVECGSPLVAVCTRCGTAATAGRFCAECGHPLPGREAGSAPAGPGTPVPDPPVSERRVVSLLFADLVGFTPLSEARDPEAVQELLSAYFGRARAVIERYGGSVEKFIGDAVCAVFGVPVAHEDDAERAVRAGLDLVSAVTALGEELRVESLQMRVGITTGSVAVTLGATGEGMVAGDAVNTAARVQAAAEPGEVWVDDTTRSLTTASLAYDSVGSHALKGKNLPIALFRAERTTAAVGGSQRVDGLEAPFVGRDRELRLVKELFHSTAEERRARLVLVAGDPGIGKSRLAWEFEKYLDAITTTTTYWLRGRCVSYGQGVAGRVVAEMVRSLLRVTEDGAEAVRLALEERLERHVPDEAERAVLRPRLLSLLGLSEEVFSQGDLFACWRGFLEALTSEGASVTIVVEDLQWADDGLLDFLDHLLEVARAPIMILALARPEVLSLRAGLGAGRRSTTVFLDPLPDHVMCRLLDGLVRDLPAELRDELVRRAEGVPLYAVETVRSLIDRDVVVPHEGRYLVDPQGLGALDLTELSPPATLHSLLAARLDSLAPEERRLVQDASVLGLSFTRSALERLSPQGVDLDRALDDLRRKEILTVDDDPRSPERGQLRFVQALLRGVAYETLSRRDRKARHLLVADYLAVLPEAHTLAGVIAQHVLDAAAAVPDDPDVAELEQRAVGLLERAAEHAMTVGAPADALSSYRRLLALDPPDEVVLRICDAAAEVTRRLGRHLDEGVAAVQRGLAAAERAGMLDRPAAQRLRVSRSDFRLQAGERTPEAMQDALSVLADTQGHPDRLDVTMRAARVILVMLQYTRDTPLAQEVALGALADVERYGDDAQFATLLDTLSIWLSLAGHRKLNTIVRSDLAARVDPLDPVAPDLLGNCAAVLLYDDVAVAQGMAEKGRGAALAQGVSTIASDGHLLVALALSGKWPAARELIRAREERTDFLDWEAYVDAGAALVAWWSDDLASLAEPADASMFAQTPGSGAWTRTRDGVTAALEGRLTAAAETLVAAVARLAEFDTWVDDLTLPLLVAVDLLVENEDRGGLERIVHMLEPVPPGQRDRMMQAQLLRAKAHLSDSPAAGLHAAAALLEEMGAHLCAEIVRVELGAALATAGEYAAAESALDQAEAFLRELGAARVLRRLNEVRSGIRTRVP